MVEIGFWVEADYMWNLAGGVTMDTFASFGVPELHITIIRGSKKLCTIIIEGYVSDSFGMAIVGTEKLAVMVDVPDLHQLECLR